MKNGWTIILIMLLIVFVICLASKQGELFDAGADNSDYLVIQQDIAKYYGSGTKYIQYRAILDESKSTKLPLTPWQFERLMNLAKKNELTIINIGLIMNL